MAIYSIFRRYLKKCLKHLVLSLIPVGTLAAPSMAENPAFPGAIGFGKESVGWRGGDIITVSNLRDRGEGSLRYCLETLTQPRVCLFSISGTIQLEAPIFVSSNVYVAGQTAPKAGIQLRLKSPVQTPIIIKNANNVLMRYLKIRPGAGEQKSGNIDAVTVESSNNIYLDALSLQFASDETFNIHVNKNPVFNITLARSILSHSLDKSVHPKGNHSKGALICSNEGSLEAESPPCGLITIAKNLFSHHRDRNPDIKGTDVGPIEVINNVFYNPISQLGEFYDVLGDVTIHYVGNITQTGPSTSSFPKRLRSVEVFDWDDRRSIQIYEADNLNFASARCGRRSGTPILDRAAKRVRIDSPISPLSFEPYSAVTLRKKLVTEVGANLDIWGAPDAIDALAISDFLQCQGKVINTTEEIGGWPSWTANSPLADSDFDGLPDDWEIARSGLNPAVEDQTWEDRNNDGWSNIEEYLSSLADDKF